jgi:hypothetical protein
LIAFFHIGNVAVESLAGLPMCKSIAEAVGKKDQYGKDYSKIPDHCLIPPLFVVSIITIPTCGEKFKEKSRHLSVQTAPKAAVFQIADYSDIIDWLKNVV